MSILDEIFAHKHQEVALSKRRRPLAEVRAAAEAQPTALDFIAALRRNHAPADDGVPGEMLQKPRHDRRVSPALIAEIKFASPSRGLLFARRDPIQLAQIYQANGAAAISVLTDERYFQGNLDYLSQISQEPRRLPLLRKDFIFDPYQVYEGRAAGADAVLLIAAMLEPALITDLSELAEGLGMVALVEVHNREELETVLGLGARLVGINNRDLHSFKVCLQTTLELAPFIPEEVCLVAESGIHTRQDVERLAQAGVEAILVGEALVSAADIPAKVGELAGVQFGAGKMETPTVNVQ